MRAATRMCRRTVLVIALAACASTAFARNVPNPVTWSMPGGITLVGHSGVADPAGLFFCVIRDITATPVPNAQVTVDLSGAPDLDLCAMPGLPGLIVNSANKAVTGFTDENGRVDFIIVGGSHGAATSQRGTVRIYADGVLGTNTTPSSGFICATPDLDNHGGLGANDVSILLADIGSGEYHQRSDLDFSGGLGANDIAVMLQAIGRATSVESCP